MQVQIIFPKERRQKMIDKLKNQLDRKVPIVLYFNKEKRWRSLKQYMLVTIQPQSSLHQFFKVIEAKLVWAGYLEDNNRALYMYAKQKQIIINEKKIQAIYEQNKSEDGWLELTLMSVNAFG